MEKPVRVCYGKHLNVDGTPHQKGETFHEWYKRIEALHGFDDTMLAVAHVCITLPVAIGKVEGANTSGAARRTMRRTRVAGRVHAMRAVALLGGACAICEIRRGRHLVLVRCAFLVRRAQAIRCGRGHRWCLPCLQSQHAQLVLVMNAQRWWVTPCVPVQWRFRQRSGLPASLPRGPSPESGLFGAL